MSNLRFSALLALAGLSSLPALAQPAFTQSQPYVVGQLVTMTQEDEPKKTTGGWSVMVGSRSSEYFGGELAYINVYNRNTMAHSAVAARGVITLPVLESNMALMIKLGYSRAGSSLGDNAREGFTHGLAFAYTLAEGFDVRVDYDRIPDTEERDVRVWGLGFAKHF